MYNSAVCLVSGGLDSCVTAAIASKKVQRLAFLHAIYGQRTADRELKAFQKIADFFNATASLVVDLTYLKKIGGSALTNTTIPLPNGEYNRKEIPISYVPFRNANLLSVAASWAEAIGLNQIYIGAVEEDSSGYPDCRREFFSHFNKVIDVGTKPETNVKICTPLIQMSKAQIVLKGIELNAPLDLTWSCYQNNKNACGECDSCLLRLRGFEQAGIPDPIPYL